MSEFIEISRQDLSSLRKYHDTLKEAIEAIAGYEKPSNSSYRYCFESIKEIARSARETYS